MDTEDQNSLKRTRAESESDRKRSHSKEDRDHDSRERDRERRRRRTDEGSSRSSSRSSRSDYRRDRDDRDRDYYRRDRGSRRDYGSYDRRSYDGSRSYRERRSYSGHRYEGDRRYGGYEGGGRRYSRYSSYGRSSASALPPPVDPKAEEEKHARTVLATNVSVRANEDQVRAFFEQAGKVIKVGLVTDRLTGKHKGIGYIEYEKVESIPAAMALSGTMCGGVPVTVQRTQAEKNLTIAPKVFGNPRKLRVQPLHELVTADDLKTIFEIFGPIKEIQREPDHAIVMFEKAANAHKAQALNDGIFWCGNRVRVAYLLEDELESMPQGFPAASIPGFPQSQHQPPPPPPPSSGPNAIVPPAYPPANSVSSHVPIPPELKAKFPGVPPAVLQAIASAQAAAAASAGATVSGANSVAVPTSVASGMTNTGMPANGGISERDFQSGTITVPSLCLRLGPMFDPAEEEEGFEEEIAEDVKEEAEETGGKVLHIFVDKESQGNVYLKMESLEAADKVFKNLNGRWFAGKLVIVHYMSESWYSNQFPESKSQ